MVDGSLACCHVLRGEHSHRLAARAGGSKPASRSTLERLFLTCCLRVVIVAANYSLRASGSCCVGLAEAADSIFVRYELCGASHARGNCVCRRKLFGIFFSLNITLLVYE